MTEKLYYKDAYIKNFSSRVLSCEPTNGGYAIVLAATAFFPEEGGQSADHGMIGKYRVIDVREKGGIIYHLTEEAPKVGKSYNCYIDFDERYDKMKQQLEDMESKLSEQSRHCTELEAENQALEEKYTRLKMARLIDMADDDELKTTRKRINKMIASVDKCLATLKVQ